MTPSHCQCWILTGARTWHKYIQAWVLTGYQSKYGGDKIVGCQSQSLWGHTPQSNSLCAPPTYGRPQTLSAPSRLVIRLHASFRGLHWPEFRDEINQNGLQLWTKVSSLAEIDVQTSCTIPLDLYSIMIWCSTWLNRAKSSSSGFIQATTTSLGVCSYFSHHRQGLDWRLLLNYSSVHEP